MKITMMPAPCSEAGSVVNIVAFSFPYGCSVLTKTLDSVAESAITKETKGFSAVTLVGGLEIGRSRITWNPYTL